jgi:hypothetical protein
LKLLEDPEYRWEMGLKQAEDGRLYYWDRKAEANRYLSVAEVPLHESKADHDERIRQLAQERWEGKLEYWALCRADEQWHEDVDLAAKEEGPISEVLVTLAKQGYARTVRDERGYTRLEDGRVLWELTEAGRQALAKESDEEENAPF